MAGYPYHTESSFVRYPSYYVHDAFGHVGSDDIGKRTPCFRKLPHTGTDVSSKTPATNKPKQRQTPVVSPIYGEIIDAGFDVEAGNYHIIKHDKYNEWWILGHHSAFAKSSGHVYRGQHVANMGDTGGAKGVHLHITVATSLAAARRYITGYINYRDGRSVAGWAASMGLVDPWPLIEREWADEVRRLKAEKEATKPEPPVKTQEQIEEEEMAAAADEIKSVVRRESRPRLRERAKTGELMLVKIEDGYKKTWHPRDWPTWEDDLTRNHEAILTDEEVRNRQKLDETQWALFGNLADEQLARIGEAAARALKS